ncbi:MAG: GWxTD domain-containing protein, partial [Candidatus Acidiferrales bacterium]
RYEENQLANSTLILADALERVPSKNIGRGQFVIGDTKVRPAVGKEFTPEERLGIYLQVYNLAVDEATKKPNATLDYAITQGDKVVFSYSESTADLENPGQQITVEKVLGLGSFAPGQYELRITVTDKVGQRTITPSATFRVRARPG